MKITAFKRGKSRLPVSLLKEARPAVYTPHQTSYVHEVKVGLGVCPLKLGIVNFKFEIWRNPGGLNWGEICANDSCGRVFVRKIAVERKG